MAALENGYIDASKCYFDRLPDELKVSIFDMVSGRTISVKLQYQFEYRKHENQFFDNFARMVERGAKVIPVLLHLNRMSRGEMSRRHTRPTGFPTANLNFRIPETDHLYALSSSFFDPEVDAVKIGEEQAYALTRHACDLVRVSTSVSNSYKNGMVTGRIGEDLSNIQMLRAVYQGSNWLHMWPNWARYSYINAKGRPEVSHLGLLRGLTEYTYVLSTSRKDIAADDVYFMEFSAEFRMVLKQYYGLYNSLDIRIDSEKRGNENYDDQHPRTESAYNNYICMSEREAIIASSIRKERQNTRSGGTSI